MEGHLDGHNESVEFLLTSGADVDAVNSAGATALFLAAVHGFSAIARLLLDHGADATVKTRDGGTALTAAQLKSHSEMAELLRAVGPKSGVTFSE